MIFRKTEADYFSLEGWTGQISLKLLGKFVFLRIVFCGKFPDLCPLKTLYSKSGTWELKSQGPARSQQSGSTPVRRCRAEGDISLTTPLLKPSKMTQSRPTNQGV